MPCKTIALITANATTLLNFRAPLIRTLHHRGIKVVALAPNFDGQIRAEVSALGAIPVDCPISRTGMNPLVDVINTLRMARILRQIRPNITLGYSIKPVIFGSLAAWMARVPRRFAMVEGLGFVFTPRSQRLSLVRRMLKRMVLTLYKIGFSCAQKAIFLNPDDLNEFVAADVIPMHKTFLLGGIGVDLEQWQKAPAVIEPVTFVLAARLLHEKGIGEYVEAARIVKKDYPNTRFILLGGLDENPGAIKQAKVEGWVAEGVLEWHGHVPVRPFLVGCSVFVLPSYREGVPTSTQEAMATGRAVVTTDAPGCRETVQDGLNGFLVPLRNSKALAERMARFVEQPHLIEVMGEASNKMARERFDVHKVNKRLIDLLFGPSGD